MCRILLVCPEDMQQLVIGEKAAESVANAVRVHAIPKSNLSTAQIFGSVEEVIVHIQATDSFSHQNLC